MARLSNVIEQYLLTMLKEEGGSLEIQRSVLAERFSCAPSQINYVLTTRFTPYKGYFVESRRGGGGYIRILRVHVEEEREFLEMLLEEVGEEITQDKALDLVESLGNMEKITPREMQLMQVAMMDQTLCDEKEERNRLRARILDSMLVSLFS